MRISTQSSFTQVLLGIRRNQIDLSRAQEQVATGRRLLRPSDDPAGMGRALSLTRQLADVTRLDDAIGAGLFAVDSAASHLQDASSLLSEARELLIQGMNGTLSPADRESLASEFELLRDQLLEIANQKSGDRRLFAGTETSGPAWQEVTQGGIRRAVYLGNEEEQRVRVGVGVDVGINVPGSRAFGGFERKGAVYSGLTGVARGLTADEGSGYEYLDLRHDSTDPGSLSSVSVFLANGGTDDTFLGIQNVVIDGTARTIRLGSGPLVQLPEAGSAGLAQVVVENKLGGELHLDLSAWTGADYTGPVRGLGSISLDGTSYTAIDYSETDLALTHPESGATVHVDTRNARRSGRELVGFSGAVNVFDTLQGIADDLRNEDGLKNDELVPRLDQRFDELQRNHENVLVALGVLGSRGSRLRSADDRMRGMETQLQGLLSDVQDADLSEVALDLAQAANALQIAQASGARLIQTSLLNFLR